MPQAPDESQLVQPVLLPLAPQHLPPRHVPDEQEEEDEQEPPSEILHFLSVSLPFPVSVYPGVHSTHLPPEPQLVHSSCWQLVPAHRPSLQTPDEQEEDAVVFVPVLSHPLPSDFLG